MTVALPLFESFVQSLYETHYLSEEETAGVTQAGFDFKAFKALPSRKAKMSYALKHLEKLGAGSSRVALAMGPDRVLKIAKNEKGIAQNEVEANIARNEGSEMVTQVFASDHDNVWVESERARPFDYKVFKNYTGFTFQMFVRALDHYTPKKVGIGHAYIPNYDDIVESEFFSSVYELSQWWDLPTGDLGRPSSWGIAPRHGKQAPVLIDYGLNRDTFDSLY